MTNDPARRLERVVVDLTTHVRRIADALDARTDDAPTTGGGPARDCPACEVGVPHDAHCPTPETHNWGCGCPTDGAPSESFGYEHRDTLGVLLSRAARGVLTADEGPLLRQHVEHLLGERDQLAARVATLEHVAAGNKRHVQIVVPELEQAEAALVRVRAECDTIEAETDPGRYEVDKGLREAIERVRAVLDGPAGGE